MHCLQNEELAAFAAQQYYVEHGSDMNIEELVGLVHNYIPDPCLQGSGMTEKWSQMIVNVFIKVSSCCYYRSLIYMVIARLLMCVTVLNDPVSKKKL